MTRALPVPPTLPRELEISLQEWPLCSAGVLPGLHPRSHAVQGLLPALRRAQHVLEELLHIFALHLGQLCRGKSRSWVQIPHRWEVEKSWGHGAGTTIASAEEGMEAGWSHLLWGSCRGQSLVLPLLGWLVFHCPRGLGNPSARRPLRGRITKCSQLPRVPRLRAGDPTGQPPSPNNGQESLGPPVLPRHAGAL